MTLKLVKAGDVEGEASGKIPRGAKVGIFVDPGSYATGWCAAIPQPDYGVKILAAGEIGFQFKHAKHPYHRITDIRNGLARLMNSMTPSPSLYLIEVTSGKVNKRRHKGGGAGLAIFGVAVGALWQMGLMWKPEDGSEPPVVMPVTENQWKGSFGKLKSVRVAEKYSDEYDPQVDPEFNIADAIALAVWYYTLYLRKAAKSD